MKLSTSTEEQKTVNISDKIRPPGQSETDQYSSNQSETKQDQETKNKTKIAILRSGVILDAEFKNNVRSLLQKESPYMEILAELEEGRVEVEKNG